MNDIISFTRLFLEVIGGITVTFSIITFFWATLSWILGAAPLFYRLGFGRWSRKIAIAASDEFYTLLKEDLKGTGIFREKNIYQIQKSALAKVKDASLVLVHYQSFTVPEIDRMLADKKTDTGFIVYFPEFSSPTNMIPKDVMDRINNHQFTIVVNTRGRLINDILTTLLSTSYEER